MTLKLKCQAHVKNQIHRYLLPYFTFTSYPHDVLPYIEGPKMNWTVDDGLITDSLNSI